MTHPAFERVDATPGVELHVCRSGKFKGLAVRVRLLEPLDERAASRSVLAGVLRRGTRRSPDLMSVARRLEALFGAALVIDVGRIGEWQASDATLHAVHGRHVGRDDLLRRGLEFVRELLLDPAVEPDGGFREREFEQERSNLRRAIESLKDDKAAFAHQRLVDTMFEGEPYARHDYGSLEDVAALDRREVLDYHRDRIRRAPLFVFAIGDFADADVAELGVFAAALAPQSGSAAARFALPPVVYREPRGRRGATEPDGAAMPRTLVEEVDATQSHLLVGMRFDPRGLARGEQMAYSILSSVLGGGAHSLLFREVRERAGLAYSAHASLDRQKGFLALYAGIRRGEWERARDLMRAQVARVAAGGCDAAAIEAARSALLHAVRTTLDSPIRALEFAARAHATGWPIEPGAYLDALAATSCAAVAAAAARLREDTCYLAAGTPDEVPSESVR